MSCVSRLTLERAVSGNPAFDVANFNTLAGPLRSKNEPV